MTKGRRKERERLARRQEILRAAREVFAAKGLHAATLDEIAERADFAKGTLYGYFKNKDDLFLSMLEEEIKNFGHTLRSVLSQRRPPVETIGLMVETIMQTFAQNVDLMRLLTQERWALTTGGGRLEARFMPLFRELTATIADLVRTGIQQRAFRRVDPERTAVAVFNLCHGAAIASFLNQRRIDSAQDVHYITGLLLKGIIQK